MNLGPLWSLCVEEQFYLLWPFVVFCIKSRSRLLTLCCTVIPVTLALRIFLVVSFGETMPPLVAYWGTYTRWDTLLFGAWLALYLRNHTLTRAQIKRYSAFAIVVGFLLFLGPLHFDVSRVRLENGLTTTLGLSALALLCTGLVALSLDNDSIFSRCLRWPVLGAIGRVSYGIYFFHGLALPALHTLADKHKGSRIPLFAADVLGTYLLAQFSFRYWESPFLRLKDRWAPQSLKGHLHVPIPQPIPTVAESRVTLA